MTFMDPGPIHDYESILMKTILPGGRAPCTLDSHLSKKSKKGLRGDIREVFTRSTTLL
jgi:hypothetical protein